MVNKIFLMLFLQTISGICRAQEIHPAESSEKDKIILINYLSVGGGRPGFVELKITRDSISYKQEIYSDTTGTMRSIIKEEKNNRKTWLNIVKSITLSDFYKLKSARPQSPMDGSDKILTLNTKSGEHQLFLDNDNSANIRYFLSQIEIICKKFNSKVRIFN